MFHFTINFVCISFHCLSQKIFWVATFAYTLNSIFWDHPFMTSANFQIFYPYPHPVGKFPQFLTLPRLKSAHVLNGWSLTKKIS